MIQRFNSDGNTDSTYGTNSVVASNLGPGISNLVLQNDGKLLGSFVNQDGSPGSKLIRFNVDGSIDATFGNSGVVTASFNISKLLLQRDGRIIVGGTLNGDFALARYNGDGTLDTSFGHSGMTTTDFGGTEGISDMAIVGNRLYAYGTGILAAYQITVGCTPPTFKNDGTIVLDASCGNNDGQISIIPTTGSAPFMYSIDGGATYKTGANTGSGFTNLAPGTYKLRLKDANGCESAIVEKVVNSYYGGPAFLNNGQIVLDASCGNKDGNITIQPTCGVPPFMYSLDGGATYVSAPNTGFTFGNLAPGTYKLRLKDAAGRESAIVERTVRSVYAPLTFLNNGQIVLDASCANNDGNITIQPTSGNGPFMYSINGGATYVSGPNTGYTFANLSSGTYQLRLKAANGCESAIIERRVALNCTTSCTPPTFLNNGTIVLGASCANNDGNITIQPTSGTAPFMYSINGGATYFFGANTGYTFGNLSAGTYQLRLKDAKGCESAIVERTVNIRGSVTVNIFEKRDARCLYDDGSIIMSFTIDPPARSPIPIYYSIDGGKTYSDRYNVGSLATGIYRLRNKYGVCESPIVEVTISREPYDVRYCPTLVATSNIGNVAAIVPNLSNVADNEAISAYPNPTKGQFKLQLKNFMSQKAEVSIFNGEGKLVQKRQLNGAGTNTVDFDLTGKAPGIYYIKITSNSGTRTFKVLVQ